ncbi:MAG: hypothetical protein ACTTHL_06925, partial [Oribacterium sp.]
QRILHKSCALLRCVAARASLTGIRKTRSSRSSRRFFAHSCCPVKCPYACACKHAPAYGRLTGTYAEKYDGVLWKIDNKKTKIRREKISSKFSQGIMCQM